MSHARDLLLFNYKDDEYRSNTQPLDDNAKESFKKDIFCRGTKNLKQPKTVKCTMKRSTCKTQYAPESSSDKI